MKPVDRVLLRILPFSFSVLLFYSCAPAPVKPPSPPYSPSQVRQIVSEMRNEAMRITAFFSSGKLTFEEGRSQSVAQVLVVGTWQPFKVKIEATHSWGRPLVHIVIHGTKIHVLSFPEKRIYWGQLGSSVLTRFLPGGLDRDQIWSFVRGYPMLVDHAYAVSHQANRIRLLDGGGNALEQIEFYPESHLPRLVSFPPRGVNLFFFDYQTEKRDSVCTKGPPGGLPKPNCRRAFHQENGLQSGLPGCRF